MTAREIYSKTMSFNFAKLLLGLATVIISAVLFGIFLGIGLLFGDGVEGFMLLLWLSATGVVRFVIMHYFGYLVKAGHIAVIIEAIATGQVPENQVEAGKKMVTERFATSNIYFGIDKMVSGAVKQLQRVLEKAGNALDFILGMNAIVGIGKMFIDISLGYIDECCLGYTFYKKDQNAFKSAADGVVIYAQNWKHLLKSAAKTTFMVIILIIVITLLVFMALGILFRLLNINGMAAFLIAVFIAFTIKFAFIDSWILVKTMVSYMEVAPDTAITFDLYNKLCSMSGKFKELFNKGQHENKSQQPAYATATNYVEENTAEKQISTEKTVFCGQCGEKNDKGTKLCIKCGEQL